MVCALWFERSSVAIILNVHVTLICRHRSFFHQIKKFYSRCFCIIPIEGDGGFGGENNRFVAAHQISS